MKTKLKTILPVLAMILLIINPATATIAISEGLDLCLRVIIPSLFPYFFITALLNSTLTGMHIPGLHHLCKFLKIPNGGESLIILGLLGGYPVGAKMIGDAYKDGTLEEESARRMLSYCSNAGPAFIFGIAGSLFPSVLYPCLLWGIHILSALLTGLMLPKPEQQSIHLYAANQTTATQALQNSIRVTAIVCGWILIFKVILAYIYFATDWLNLSRFNVYIGGIVELSNGCVQLTQLRFPALRFILCCAFLAFGGLCILLQTISVINGLGIRFYLLGKLIQLGISIIMGSTTALILFHDFDISPLLCSVLLIICTLIFIIRRKCIKMCGNFAHNTV